MDSSVKSARRVFEFLEYMAKVQRAVSVAEVARHYAYPNSSVSSVMRTMVSLGYLSYDAGERTYLPTVRLPFLINWVGTKLFHHDRLKRLMDELSDLTGETILLGVQSGLRAQYVHVIDAKGPLRMHAESGEFRPLAWTAVGQILLSQYSNHKAGNMLRRINDSETDPARQVDVPAMLDQLEQVRKLGYALSVGGIVPGGGALAMLLPESMNGNPLAIAVAAGELSLMRSKDRWVSAMREAIIRTYQSVGDDDPGG